MFDKALFRSVSRTILAEVLVQEITDNTRSRLARQTSAVGLDNELPYSTYSVVVGPNGYQLEETSGFLYIETAEPINCAFGNSSFVINRQFLVHGSFPQAVLTAESDRRINIIQY